MAKNSKLPGWPDMMAPPFTSFAQGFGDSTSAGNPLAQSLTNGMDFMKNMWGRMPSSVPGFVVPTVDIGELDKRIEDLRAVESWLALNGNMLKATIQGLEVQRNTLAALKALGEKGDFLQAAMQKGFAPTVPVPASNPTASPGVSAFEQLFGQGSANANWPLGAQASHPAGASDELEEPEEPEEPDQSAHPTAASAAPEAVPPEMVSSEPKAHKRHKKAKKAAASSSGRVSSAASVAPSVAVQSANMWMNFLKDQFGQIASAALAQPAVATKPAKTAPGKAASPAKSRRPALKKASRKRASAKSPPRVRS